jgi:iron(III) transport system substrate-binding protein
MTKVSGTGSGLNRRTLLTAMAGAAVGGTFLKPGFSFAQGASDDIPNLNAALAELYAKARAAGETRVVYYTNSNETADAVGPLFQKRFPGIAFSGEMYEPLAGGARVLSELSRGSSADVFECSFLQGRPIEQRAGFDKSIDWSKYGVPAARVGFAGTVQCFHSLLSHGYNPKKANAAELPKKIADFLDPKWRGRLATNAFQLCAHLAWHALKTKDTEGAIAWAKALRENQDIAITGTLDSSTGLVAQGEKAVHVYGTYAGFRRNSSQGASLDVFSTENMGGPCFLLGVLDKAKSPLSAQLLALWMLGAEAQEALWKSAYSSWGLGNGGLARYVKEHNIDVVWETLDNYSERAQLNQQIRKAMGFA